MNKISNSLVGNTPNNSNFTPISGDRFSSNKKGNSDGNDSSSHMHDGALANASNEALNAYRNQNNSLIDRENIYAAIDGKEAQDRTLMEQIELDQILERMNSDPGFRPKIIRAETASLADIKNGKVKGNALSKGVSAAYIPKKGIILVSKGLADVELKKALKEEYGEWFADQAGKRGISVKPGDVGARILKALDGMKTTTNDFKTDVKDKTTVTFEGKAYTAKARTSNTQTNDPRYQTDTIQLDRRAERILAPISWDQFKIAGIHAKGPLTANEIGIALQLLNGGKKVDNVFASQLMRQGVIVTYDEDQQPWSLDLSKLTSTQTKTLVANAYTALDSGSSIYKTMNFPRGISTKFANKLGLLREDIDKLSGNGDNYADLTEINKAIDDGVVKFDKNLARLVLGPSYERQKVYNALGKTKVTENEVVHNPIIKWAEGKNDISGALIMENLLGGKKITAERLVPFIQSGVVWADYKGELNLDLSKLSRPEMVKLLDEVNNMQHPNSHFAKIYTLNMRQSWQPVLTNSLGLRDSRLSKGVDVEYGNKDGKMSHAELTKAVNDGGVIIKDNKFVLTSDIAIRPISSTLLRPSEFAPTSISFRINTHEHGDRHYDTLSFEYYDEGKKEWIGANVRSGKWDNTSKPSRYAENTVFTIPIKNGKPPILRLTNNTYGRGWASGIREGVYNSSGRVSRADFARDIGDRHHHKNNTENSRGYSTPPKVFTYAVPFRDTDGAYKFKLMGTGGNSATSKMRNTALIGVGVGAAGLASTGVGIPAAAALTAGLTIATIAMPRVGSTRVAASAGKIEWWDGGNVDFWGKADGLKDMTVDYQINYQEVTQGDKQAVIKYSANGANLIKHNSNKSLASENVESAFAAIGLTYDKSLSQISGLNAGSILTALNGNNPLSSTAIDKFIAQGVIKVRSDATWSLSPLALEPAQRAQIVKGVLSDPKFTPKDKTTLLNRIGLSNNDLSQIDTILGNGDGKLEAKDITDLGDLSDVLTSGRIPSKQLISLDATSLAKKVPTFPAKITPDITSDEVLSVGADRHQLNKISKLSIARLYERLGNAPYGSDGAILHNLMKAQGVAASGQYTGKIDKAGLQKDLHTYLTKPAIVKLSQKIHDEVFTEVTGLTPKQAGDRLKQKMLSPEMKATVLAMSPQKRASFIKNVVHKAFQISPKVAGEIQRGYTVDLFKGVDLNMVGLKKLEMATVARQKTAKGERPTAEEAIAALNAKEATSVVFERVYGRARALLPASAATLKTLNKYRSTAAGIEGLESLLTIFQGKRVANPTESFEASFRKALNDPKIPAELNAAFFDLLKYKGGLRILNGLDAACSTIALGYGIANIAKKRNAGKKLSAADIVTVTQELMATIGGLGSAPDLALQFFGVKRTKAAFKAAAKYDSAVLFYKTSYTNMVTRYDTLEPLLARSIELQSNIAAAEKYIANRKAFTKTAIEGGQQVTPAVKAALDDIRIKQVELQSLKAELAEITPQVEAAQAAFNDSREVAQNAFNIMADSRYDALKVVKGDPRFAEIEAAGIGNDFATTPFNEFSESVPGLSVQAQGRTNLTHLIDQSAMESAEAAAAAAPNVVSPAFQAVSKSAPLAKAFQVFGTLGEASFIAFGVNSALFADQLRRGGDTAGAVANGLQSASFIALGTAGTIGGLAGLGVPLGALEAAAALISPPVAIVLGVIAAGAAISNWVRADTERAAVKKAKLKEILNDPAMMGKKYAIT